VGVHNLSGDGEAEADAAGGGFAFFPDLDEFFKDGCLCFQGDAGTVVRHRDPDLLRLRRGADPDLAARRGVAQGVAEQIGEDVAQLLGIAQKCRHPLHFAGEADLFVPERQAQGADGLLHDLGEVEGHHLHLVVAGFKS